MDDSLVGAAIDANATTALMNVTPNATSANSTFVFNNFTLTSVPPREAGTIIDSFLDDLPAWGAVGVAGLGLVAAYVVFHFWERRNATREIATEWNDGEIAEIRTRFRRRIPIDPSASYSFDALTSYFLENEVARLELVAILNHLHIVSIGHELKLFDRRLIEQLYGNIIVDYYVNFREYVMTARARHREGWEGMRSRRRWTRRRRRVWGIRWWSTWVSHEALSSFEDLALQLRRRGFGVHTDLIQPKPLPQGLGASQELSEIDVGIAGHRPNGLPQASRARIARTLRQALAGVMAWEVEKARVVAVTIVTELSHEDAHRPAWKTCRVHRTCALEFVEGLRAAYPKVGFTIKSPSLKDVESQGPKGAPTRGEILDRAELKALYKSVLEAIGDITDTRSVPVHQSLASAEAPHIE